MFNIVFRGIVIDCSHETCNRSFEVLQLFAFHTAGLVQHQHDVQRGGPSRLLDHAGHPGFELDRIGAVSVFSGRLDELRTLIFSAVLCARFRSSFFAALIGQHVQRQ